MKKSDFNTKFREYAKTLSPTSAERDLISKIYQSFNDLLGINNCIQIGSYPRFTAVTPVHDLDVLYFLGDWNEDSHDPSVALQILNKKINDDYENPTEYQIKVSPQTHSVTISYLKGGEEMFSVDIVPAYIIGKNEFGDDTYKIPEVAERHHGSQRIEYYQKLMQEHGQMNWINSDPRGYIRIASDIDVLTKGEFRKAVKFIKAWKNNLKASDETLKLKSFHIEQIIVRTFQGNPCCEIFDAIFTFFTDLPEIIEHPKQIKDRAYNDKYIDDYLADFSEEQKKKIKQARDGFLVKLESFKESDSVEKLLEINIFPRVPSEQFLFDSGIKVFTDSSIKLKIDGFVKPLPGFSPGWITESPQLQKGITCGAQGERKIEFSIKQDNTQAVEHRWKVKNGDDTAEPRGEITMSQTKNKIETTKFASNSYVECYAIRDGICIARSKLNVKII